MKNPLFFSFLLFSIVLTAQDFKLEKAVNDIKAKIVKTENAERLKWLDSLTKLTEYNSDFKYDSIVSETIQYALQLDSINLATIQTSNLIYFKNNISIKPAEGLQIFKNFLQISFRSVLNLHIFHLLVLL